MNDSTNSSNIGIFVILDTIGKWDGLSKQGFMAWRCQGGPINGKSSVPVVRMRYITFGVRKCIGDGEAKAVEHFGYKCKMKDFRRIALSL